MYDMPAACMSISSPAKSSNEALALLPRKGQVGLGDCALGEGPRVGDANIPPRIACLYPMSNCNTGKGIVETSSNELRGTDRATLACRVYTSLNAVYVQEKAECGWSFASTQSLHKGLHHHVWCTRKSPTERPSFTRSV